MVLGSESVVRIHEVMREKVQSMHIEQGLNKWKLLPSA